MKTATSIILTSAFVLAVADSVYGQNTAPATTTSPASQGSFNDWLRQESPEFKSWDFGGQFRLRLEHKEFFAAPGAMDFQSNGESDNTYLLLRETVHLGYTPVSWLTLFAEGRDSSSTGDDRNPNPESNAFDLHQGYVSLGNPNSFPLMAKVGRQELSYGDERLIGAFDWNNIGRVFDAAKLRYQSDAFWLDAFGGRVVLADDNNFDVPNDYDWFSGIYASTRTLIPKQETQAYILARNTGPGSPTADAGAKPQPGGPPPRDIYTLGLRMKSLPGQYGNWDYGLEAAGQLGRYKDSVTGPSLDQEAWAAHVEGGYTWKSASLAPRVGLAYSFATGDSNPADGKHQTFENLFPTNHKFYGYMDFVSWQNIHDPQLTASVKASQQLTLTGDVHGFWLAETSDSFYTVAGTRRGPIARTTAGYGVNPNHDSYLGAEIDLVGTYAFKSGGAIQVGYGHFFVGDYIKSSLANIGGATDADYIYGQLVFSF